MGDPKPLYPVPVPILYIFVCTWISVPFDTRYFFPKTAIIVFEPSRAQAQVIVTSNPLSIPPSLRPSSPLPPLPLLSRAPGLSLFLFVRLVIFQDVGPATDRTFLVHQGSTMTSATKKASPRP